MPSRIASWFVIVGVVFTGCLSIRAGQTTVRPSVFTAEQAEAGLKELQTNSFGKCTDCHGNNLGSRNGDPGELPLLSSLREEDQTMVTNYGGKVPALVGPTFRAR